MNNFNWISHFLKDKKHVRGLDDLFPNVFDRYLLIPWTTGMIDNFPFADYPENKDTLANLNMQHSIEREFGIFLNAKNEAHYRRVTLKEISDKFQVPYCSDTHYLIKPTPGTSVLVGATIEILKELISRLRNAENLNLYIADYSRYEYVYDNWKYSKENIKMGVSDYLLYQEYTAWDSWSYLFPASRDWCLCTLEDYHHFIFCCNNSSYKSIQDFYSMEIFEVDYRSEINWIFP